MVSYNIGDEKDRVWWSYHQGACSEQVELFVHTLLD